MSAKAAAGVSVSECVTAAKDRSEYSSSGERVHSASFRSSLCSMRQVGKRKVQNTRHGYVRYIYVCITIFSIYVIVFMEVNIN